jgi:hypothetical protein
VAYACDMRLAAYRHFEAAEKLAEGKRRDVAGYLYGIAAECGIKAMMLDINIRPLPNERRKEDPFFAHFPDLRTMLRSRLEGRLAAPLLPFISSDAFMNNWSTDMRYSHGRDIADAWVAAWSQQARQVISSMGT